MFDDKFTIQILNQHVSFLILHIKYLVMRLVLIYFSFVISLIISFNSSTFQPQTRVNDGYKHYSGTLDTNMLITFDLLSQNGTITGYYYYGFPVPGDEGFFQYGKTMAVVGNIEGERFEIREKINPQSRFIGIFHDNGNMTGKWMRQTYQQEVKFELEENYNHGSIKLKSMHHYDYHYVEQNNITNKNMPKAEIDISFLVPENKNNQVADTINFYISQFASDTTIPFTTYDKLMKEMANSFFNSYQTTTEGIPNIELLSSFNWQKKYTSEVLYNDNYLLSLRLEKYAYTGGAHGVGIQNNLVFDLKKNQRILLNDLFYEGFEPRLNALIDKKLRKLNDLNSDENLQKAGFLIEEIGFTNNFFLNNDGIVFYYNVYEIAPYASGPLEIAVPYYELRGILKDQGPISWIQ